MTLHLSSLCCALFLLVQLAAAQTITSPAGTGKKGYSGDGGPAEKAELADPFDVAFDRAGNLYFSDTSNHAVRRVDAKTGTITTVAGTGTKGYSGDGGPATKAQLFEPYGIELDDENNLYIVDRLNRVIRRVDSSGTISTIAGTAGALDASSKSHGDGGPATKAQLAEPNGLALDRKGKLYIADVRDQRVRVVDLKTGVINTFCGTGKKEHSGDGGPYGEASLSGPRAVAVTPEGNVLVCEREGNSIRKIDLASGKITLVAGTGKKGYSGDGGPALEATFNGPKEIDVDRQGNIYVVDTENHAIRRIQASNGRIDTIAGSGKPGGDGDGGPAVTAKLNRPHGLAAAADGAVVIGDTLTHRIRRVK